MRRRHDPLARLRVVVFAVVLGVILADAGCPFVAGLASRREAGRGVDRVAGGGRMCLAAQFGYRTLKRGARGEDVWNLQLLLGRLGLLSVEPTGYFGAMTESAVKRLQRARRIRATGVVSGETLELVEKMLAALEWSREGYEVREGDTLETIARAWGIPVAVLARLNGIPESAELKPGDRVHVPTPELIVHDVKKGECLAGIAEAYGVEWKDLAAWNGIRSPYVIHPGDMLVIPAAPAEAPEPADPPDPGARPPATVD